MRNTWIPEDNTTENRIQNLPKAAKDSFFSMPLAWQTDFGKEVHGGKRSGVGYVSRFSIFGRRTTFPLGTTRLQMNVISLSMNFPGGVV